VALARPDLLSDEAKAIFERGRDIAVGEYREAMRERERLIAAFDDWAAAYDAILSPPAAGEAPDVTTTGDPRFCSRWSLVGAPAMSLPTGFGPASLPLGLQLIGSRGADGRLLAVAAWAQARLSPQALVSRQS
jgi:amidase